jgi:flagellar biosynthesis/type III secretory pathway M-ring protein FliF/YscJ
LLEKIKITVEEHPEEIANIVQQLMQDEMAKKSE